MQSFLIDTTCDLKPGIVWLRRHTLKPGGGFCQENLCLKTQCLKITNIQGTVLVLILPNTVKLS
jgi:hypothetical protein